MALLQTLQYIVRHPLNADRRISAVARFLRWQVGSRLVRSPVIVQWVNSSRLIAARGMTGATGNIYAGLQEFEDMAFLLHMLRQGDHFVDIGANIGAYTVLAAAAVGAWTTSIEPVPSTFAHLVNNVNVNGVPDRARCLNIGVAHEPGRLRFTAALDTTNHVLADGERCDNVIEVPVNRLDDVLGDARPILIKVDVEGFETNVVRGGERTFSAPSLGAVIMEFGNGARYGFDDDALARKMVGFGFCAYVYEPFSRALRAAEDSPTRGGNTIFVRDVEAVSRRLKDAPPFTIDGRTI